MTYRPWNMGEIRRLIDLRASGLKVAACAKRLGRTPRATAVRLWMIGATTKRASRRQPGRLKRAVVRMVRRGLMDTEIADQLKLSPSTIRNTRKRAGLPPGGNRSEWCRQAVAAREAKRKQCPSP